MAGLLLGPPSAICGKFVRDRPYRGLMLESDPDQEFEEMISELTKEILAGLDQRLAFEVYADAWDILHPTKQ